MCVGTTDPHRAHPGSARPAIVVPAARTVRHEQSGVRRSDLRIQFHEVGDRRNPASADDQGGLDQSDDARRSTEMTDVRLDRTDGAPSALSTEGTFESRPLDHIADRGRGSVRLDVPDVALVHGGAGQRRADDEALLVDTRRGEPGLPLSVVVDRAAADDGMDRVTGLERGIESFDHDRAHAARGDGATGRGVERPAAAVGGPDAARLMVVTRLVRRLHVHPAGHGHVRVAGQHALARQVHSDQRARTGALNCQRRTAEVERVGGPGGQEVVVQERHPVDRFRRLQRPGGVTVLRIAQALENHPRGSGPAGGEQRDAAGVPQWVATGILQRLEDDLHHHQVVDVDTIGLPGGDAERGTVELVMALQWRGHRHVRVSDLRGKTDPLPLPVLLGDRDHSGRAGLDVGPERAVVGRARNSAGHADDG